MCQAGCQAFDAYAIENHIHDFIAILGAAVEHNPFTPTGMTDAYPGPKFLLDNLSGT